MLYLQIAHLFEETSMEESLEKFNIVVHVFGMQTIN